jgi:hypothetical protein
MPVGTAVLVWLAASPGLEAAKHALAEQDFARVAVAFDDARLTASEKPAAARILGAASKLAWEKHDLVVAYDTASRALKLEPNLHDALEVAARVALSNGELDDAERHADRLIHLSPNSPVAFQLRSDVAQARGRSVGSDPTPPQSPASAPQSRTLVKTPKKASCGTGESADQKR